MKIYTRTGDAGSTKRPDGEGVRKSDPRIAAVGAIDELNAEIGSCVQACGESQEPAAALRAIQPELFAVGALVAAAGSKAAPNVSLEEPAVERMERQIDEIAARLPELKHFIIPGGCELACRLHVARTVCRRAERAVVAAVDAGTHVPPITLKYLNRLSDLLFTLARAANAEAGRNDAVWRSPT